MTYHLTGPSRAGLRRRGARAGASPAMLVAAACAAALCATTAHATVVHDAAGDILPSFDPKGAKTTDNFRDLDVVKAMASFDDENITLTATMAGNIGSTDTGFYVWGVDTGTGTDFFQQQAVHPEVGLGIKFDTFIVLNTNGTGSVNYFSGEPSEGLGAGSVSIHGRTIQAIIPRELIESTGLDIGEFGFNIWPRANGFGNDDIADFAPNAQNFLASGAPEPAAWALMIGGFGLAGSALRRRRRVLHAA
jgi:hypothetical protein